MSRRRAAGLAAGLALVALALWLGRSSGAVGGASWAEVRRGDLVLAVEVEGTLRATDTSLIGPPQLREYWDYKIESLAPEGQEVRAGTPVVTFDASDLRQRLERQQAEAESARKQIEKTEKSLAVARERDELRLAEAEARLRKAGLVLSAPEDLSRSRDLAEARLEEELARLELDGLRQRTEASARSARAQLAALGNQLREAERRTEEIARAIDEMVRRAPRDGTVIYATDWQDRKSKVGDSIWRGRSAVELPDLRTMKAEGRVDEADSGRLSRGQRVTLRLDAHPDVEFAGRVASIWQTVQRASWQSPLRVVRLDIDLDETDPRRMRPGMRFRGRIEVERASGVVLAPAESVFLRPAGPVAYRRTAAGWERVALRLGRRNDRQVEVLGGLAEGDEVALVDLDAERTRGRT